MTTRRLIAPSPATALLGLLAFGLSAVILEGCAAPTGLPAGPTPIPTLVPVREALAPVQPTSSPVYTIVSYPARLPSASRGQTIYVANCAGCHGEDGSGAMPAARNFRDLDYMRGETPAYFYTAVTEGRGEMPAFKDKLSSDERWDAVFYVWRLSTTTQTLATGEQVFEKNCAACHGEDGSGKLLGSADFTNQRQMDQLAPRDLYLTVTQGRGSMPSWQSRLSQDERWAVIDYLRTFTYDPALTQVGATAAPAGTSPAAPPTGTPSSQPTQAAGCSSGQTNPFAWNDAAAIKAGQTLFQAQCAACHGQDAKGLLTDTPDFTSAQVSADLKANPGRYFCAVTEGKSIMPPFGQSLSPEERWQALTYLGSLGP